MTESTTPEPTPGSQAPAASQAPQPILQPHTNTVVPHNVADYDTNLVQLNVWTGTKWVNIFDGNDFKNMSIDLHRVAKVVEDQVLEIDKAVKGANAAMDQANKAVDNSNVNKTAIDDVNKAVDEAKQSASDALDKIKDLASDSTVQDIQNSLKETTDDVAKLKDDQAQHLKDVTGQINDAVAKAKAAADSLTAKTEELQTAVKNAQSDATVATQTASEANVTAIDAKSDAAVATATAKQVTIDMTNVKSDVVAIKATASEATITAGNAASDAATAKVTASGAAVTATNAQNDAAEVKATADNLSTRMTSVEGKAAANATAIDQNSRSIALKADQTTVDKLNKTVTDNLAAVKVLNNEITSKVDSTTVNKLIDDKGFATTEQAQALIDQTANKISGTITDLKMTVDNNGNLISTTADRLTNVTQTVDGLQTTVKNKADQSQVTQLSNQLLAKVSTKDYQTEIAALEKNLNLRVQKGDVISQINLEAGGPGLIQVDNGKGKLLLDADSVVFKSKAFIPSAAIIDIAADKITSGTLDAGNIRVINLTADNIHGGTLDVGNMHVKNFTANDIEAGTLSGVTIKAGDTTDFFQTSKDNIYWITNNGDQSALIGKGTYVDFSGLNIFDSHAICLGTYAGAYLENGTIKDTGGSLGDPKFNIELPTDLALDLFSELGEIRAPLDNSRISGWVGQHEFFYLEHTQGFHVELNPDINASQFRIQKDNRIGAYFGDGNNGDQINLIAPGGGVNVTGALNVDGLRVTGAKNSVVQTSQGYVGITAYETAEYYFGDIGEADTGENSQVVIGIDKIFNETINTTVPYQVFITPYNDCHVWVDQRYGNRFVVKSDQPNAEFGWEIKAKRKGYENYRLRHVDGIKEKGEIKL